MPYDEDKLTNVPGAAIVDLTNANGTGDNTIADVTATPTQTLINNNFRDVSNKINEILVALRAANIIPLD
jgi:histidinol phosphatase-like enzyme